MSAARDPFEGVPRSELESEVCVLRATVASVVKERDAYLRQLGDVQARCTELLAVDRVMRELRPLAERIVHARAKHPEGTLILDLQEEVEELEQAYRDGDYEHARDEALDVATCAVRIVLGGDRQ